MRNLLTDKRLVLRSVMAVAVILMVSACDFRSWPHQLSNWQDDSIACAEFWDTYFPKALNGDDVAAASLYKAIIQRRLVPPGRAVDDYRQEQKEFDLLALKRLSIHKYRRSTGNAPVSPFSEAMRSPYPKGFGVHVYGKDNDPNEIQEDKDREILFQYIGSPDPNRLGICSLRSGLHASTDAWAAACRQILADDGVLPSSEELLATLPKGTKACGYKGE